MLGHNVIDQDLLILREHLPSMVLRALPVIDILRLAPLAFPQSPLCTRLVKYYKRIGDSLNLPLSHCRSTLVLFQEMRGFHRAERDQPGVASLLPGVTGTERERRSRGPSSRP